MDESTVTYASRLYLPTLPCKNAALFLQAAVAAAHAVCIAAVIVFAHMWR